jgi:AcrR family transcriptional regulator
MALSTLEHPPVRRRDQQRDETRLDFAVAAFELAKQHGLANVRVPQIAAAVGVSPRTFNNYFSSKEQALAWPATRRAAVLTSALSDRPPEEPLGDALVAAMASLYGRRDVDGLPAGWLRDFRALVANEPTLHGEYLKTADALEGALARAIADRIGTRSIELESRVVAAVVVGAERAAVLYWSRQRKPSTSLAVLVSSAVSMALRGFAGVS